MGLFRKKEYQYYNSNEGTVVNHPTDMPGGWQAERFSDIEQSSMAGQSMNQGAAENGVMNSGAMNNSAINNGTMNNGMPNNISANQSPQYDGDIHVKAVIEEQPMTQKGQVEIGKSLVIEGTVASSEDLHVAGCVRGSVTSKEDIKVSGVVIGDITNARNVELCGGRIRGNIICSGKLLIDEKSVTVGNIECASLRLDGKHKGDIKTEEDVVLGKDSLLLGNVSSDNIFMEPGAYIDGRLTPRNEISTKEIFDLIGNSSDSSR